MLDAGSVYATLGGRFNPVAFEQFDAAFKRSAASAEAGEARIRAATSRISNAVPLKAMDQWSKHSEQASRNLEKLGKVAATTTAVGILAVGAAAAYAVGKTISFNQEMLKLHTQAGASTQEVKKFSSAILAMAGHVPQGPKELAEGMYHLASAGFRGTQALQLLEAAAKGAALGNANLEDTTQALIAATASHIKGVHGAADAMGQLNAIVGVGDMRMEQLAQAMATGILPSAHDAGLSLTDVGAALATVTDNATPANVTATRLRMTLSLMAAPSKAAVKQLASIGMTSTQMAHDMRQPNGLLKAVEDLKTHLHNSGKTAEEQDAILSHVFGGGRSSAVIHTLMSEIDRLRSKYQELGKTDGAKRLQESWSEFQKKGTANVKEFQSAAEAFAISVGTVILPSVTQLAQQGAHALQGLASGGGAANIGHDITKGFELLGQIISGLAPEVETLAHVLLALGQAGVSVGQFFGLGLAGQIETAAAAFLAFRAAEFVAPMLLAAAGAMGTFVTELMTAPTAMAAVTDLFSMTNPTAIAVAIGGAAAAWVAFRSGLFSGTSAAERNAQALEADKKAIEDLRAATEGAANAQIAARRADLQHREAAEHLKQVEHEVADGSLKGAAAQNTLADARLRVAEASNSASAAHEKAGKEIENEQRKAEKAVDTLGSRQRETFKEIENVNKLIESYKKRGASEEALAPMLAKLASLQREYNREAKATAQANAEIAVSEESRRRMAAGQSAITSNNAAGVRALQEALATANVPRKLVTRYELDDQGAQAKLGVLASKLQAVGQSAVVARVLTTAPSAAAAVEALRAVIAGVPAHKVISILHNAPSASSAIAHLSAAVHAVPSHKQVAINTNAGQAASQVAGLQSNIDSLHGKEVKVTTIFEQIGKALGKHASGRGRGESETALVGEGHGPEYIINQRTGQGARVDQPTIMGLGPDDYVVPLEHRYRGRALGLFLQLAADLEIPGYKKGKKAKHAKHRAIPPHLDPLSLPVEEIQTRADNARQAYDKSHGEVKSLDGQIRTDERNLKYASKKGTTRAKDTDKLKELKARQAKAHSEERKHHAEMLADRKALREAKAYQAKITKQTDLANIAANDMKIADGHDDQGAYDAAKNRRLAALAMLKQLIEAAQKHVKGGVNNPYFRKLTEQIQGAELEGQSTEGEDFKGDPTAEREEQTGMTDAEQARLKEINKNIALAALTTGLEDDKHAASELVTFLETVLGEVQAEPAARGGDEVIADIASQLKTARDNVASLAGSGTNENSDLQAQIDQAKERAEVEKRRADIAEQSLQVFSGSGDIGAGGSTAAAAAGQPSVVQHNYMLHPADPSVLTAVGNAAVAGIGLQGARRAVRVAPGI